MFRSAFETVWNHWWEIFWLYILRFLFYIILSWVAYDILRISIDKSMIFSKMSEGYNSSIIGDLIRYCSLDIHYWIYSLIISIIPFALLSVFVNAGTIGNIAKNENGNRNILSNAKKFFVSHLKISLIVLLIFVAILAIFWIPFIFIFENPVRLNNSEKPFILLLLILVVINLLIGILLSVWTIKAKSLICLEARNPKMVAFRMIRKNIIQVLAFGIGTVLIGILFFGIVYYFGAFINIGKTQNLYLSVVLSQIQLIGGSKLRIWYQGGVIGLT